MLEDVGDTDADLLAPFDEPVDRQRMPDRLPDRHRRVQRRVRILEDDLHPAPVFAQLALVQLRDVAVLEDDAAVGGADETEQRPPESRLAAAGLADEPEHLALPEVERDVVDRPDLASLPADQALREVPADRVVGSQALD